MGRPYSLRPVRDESWFPRLTRVQFISAMEVDLGLTEADVDTAIEAMPESTPLEVAEKKLARIAWKHSTMFDRFDPLVESLMPEFDLTAEDVDPVWKAAPDKYG